MLTEVQVTLYIDNKHSRSIQKAPFDLNIISYSVDFKVWCKYSLFHPGFFIAVFYSCYSAFLQYSVHFMHVHISKQYFYFNANMKETKQEIKQKTNKKYFILCLCVPSNLPNYFCSNFDL